MKTAITVVRDNRGTLRNKTLGGSSECYVYAASGLGGTWVSPFL